MHAIKLSVQEISPKAELELAPVPVTEQDLSGIGMRREPSRENNNKTLDELSLKLNSGEEGRRDGQNSKKSFKFRKRSDQNNLVENLAENLAFYEDEVDDQRLKRLKFRLRGDGNARRRSTRSTPATSKLIRVTSTSDQLVIIARMIPRG